MPSIEFDQPAAILSRTGIERSQSPTPNFDEAHSDLRMAALMTVISADPLCAEVLTERINNDHGAINVRQGLYMYSHQEASVDESLGYVASGIDEIVLSYESLTGILGERAAEIREREPEAGVASHICATMNTWLRATRTAQVLTGELSRDRKANQAIVDAQWMIGRGKPDEPGAWQYAKQGDNGYFAVQTPLLGAQTEVMNGGFIHRLKGFKQYAFRALPQLGKRLITDPENRADIAKTFARLTWVSRSRSAALDSALDYRHF